MKKEKWVQINKIQGFEEIKDQYWISNSDEDKIINRNTRKQLKVEFIRGYSIIRLRTDQGKTRNCRVHILKAFAFLFGPNPLTYNVIRHLNDIKIDNCLENLAFGTQSDNTRDCMRNGNFNYENFIRDHTKNAIKGGIATAKKVSKLVRCIETGIIYPSALQAERELNFPRGSISHCCSGKSKTSKGFHFEFVNKEEI